jgi:hypothetical protein
MPEEKQPESNRPSQPRTGGRRRGHRGGRGRRRPAPAVPVSGQSAQSESPAKQIEPPIRLSETLVRPVPSKQKVQSPVPAPRAAKPDGPDAGKVAESAAAAVSKAVDEVRQIVESLEHALEQMEEVLKLVELAEHQKFDDEREIESLRRALRKIQPPRGRQEERPQADD